MLQQTQMGRGTEYFTRWMERFPTLEHLAAAPFDDVLKAWEGLGYYARVKNLYETARVLVNTHAGQFPRQPEELTTLPGIGPYTAGAIASIAYNIPTPLVDANVERVFSRMFDVDAPVKSTAAQKFFWSVATAAMPRNDARNFNQALMELGALVCKKTPQCTACPLAEFCHARRLQLTAERPVPGKKVPASLVTIITGLLFHNGHIFIQKRLDAGAWAGLWEFPGGRLEAGETPAQGITREFFEETEFAIVPARSLGTVQHAYTRYRITMHCFFCHLPAPASLAYDDSGFPKPALHAATEYRWVPPRQLGRFTFPAGHRKLMDAWMPLIEETSATSNPT